MRTVTVFASVLVLVLLAINTPTLTRASDSTTPVIVELFTSEACSSCPPADALLTKLSQQHVLNGAEVIALGEHVDYFNHLSWTDRFSSAEFSNRQADYATTFHLPSPYTPQIVIDGRFESLGSDTASVEEKIRLAARTTKTASITLSWTAQNKLHVTVAGASVEPCAVLFAITEDGLTTSVVSGENGGRVLRHSAVVREFRSLGITSDGAFAGTASILPVDGWKPENLRIVVFVQKPKNGQIIGASAVRFR